MGSQPAEVLEWPVGKGGDVQEPRHASGLRHSQRSPLQVQQLKRWSKSTFPHPSWGNGISSGAWATVYREGTEL